MPSKKSRRIISVTTSNTLIFRRLKAMNEYDYDDYEYDDYEYPGDYDYE
jgi:hypothetical protein